jgi:hypothetical protein
MPQFVRRIIGRDRSEDEHATASAVETLRPYLDTQRSEAMEIHSDESGHEQASVPEAIAGSNYAQLGEEVTTILNSAQEAAARMRQTAQEEAGRIQAEAAATAAATTQEANRLLEEAQRRFDEQRLASEQRAEEIQRSADAYAEEARKDAEVEARRIVAAGERRAKQLEAEARRRRDGLVAEADAVQERFQELVPEFRNLTSRLESLLPSEPARGEVDADAEPSLEEALQPTGGTQAPVG